MSQFSKNFILLAGISIFMVLMFSMANQQPSSKDLWSYSDFVSRVENGSVTSVQIQGQKISGLGSGGSAFHTFAPRQDDKLVPLLLSKGVAVNVEPPEETSWFSTFLFSWLPVIVLIAVWLFFPASPQRRG